VKEEYKAAFEAAWTEPKAAARLYKLAKGYARVFREDHEDLLQRTFLALWKKDDRWKPGDDVVYAADREMRNAKANEKRLAKHEVMVDRDPKLDDEGEEERDQDPSPEDTEDLAVRKEQHELRESVLDDADAALPTGVVGDRARVILREARRGNGDADALVAMLGCTVDQLYKARVLVADTIQAVLKRRGLPPETMNLDE
jgi:DNA-directed RNA polymerase specialized sigma24 family protein